LRLEREALGRDRSQQEQWDNAMFRMREAGVDVPRMTLEQAMRMSLRFGLRKEDQEAVRSVIPGPMSADQARWKFQLDVRDFDAGTADLDHTVLVLRSKDPGHGYHRPVFAAVFQEEWDGQSDPEDQGVRVGYGRDVLSAIQGLLGRASAEVEEGGLPEHTAGLEMPREQLLEAALADAYGRIEQLLEERGPTLRKAQELILSMEARESIGANWHPYFDQWLRTFAEWAARMGGDYWGHRDAVQLVRALFAKLSGFDSQASPEPTPSYFSSVIGGVPQPDQDRPETKDLKAETEGRPYWARRAASVEAGPPEWRTRKPLTRRDKSVTHEVVTRFNLGTGYIAWRAHRLLDPGHGEIGIETLLRMTMDALIGLNNDRDDPESLAFQRGLAAAGKVICDVMSGGPIGENDGR
jgi:hypothetical protein